MNSIFTDDNCNGCANDEFARVVNQLAKASTVNGRTGADLTGNPSSPGDRPPENKQKPAPGGKGRTRLSCGFGNPALQKVAFALAILRKTALEQTDPGRAGCVGTAFLGGRHLVEFRAPLADMAPGREPGQFERFAARGRHFRHLLRCNRDGCSDQRCQHACGEKLRNHGVLRYECFVAIIFVRVRAGRVYGGAAVRRDIPQAARPQSPPGTRRL